MNHYREIEGLPVSMISERTQYRPAIGAVNPNIKIQERKTGTTTVGIVGVDFVLLAADQQATMGYMAADDDARKIYKITNKIAVTISGTVGDSLAIIRFLKAQANLYEIERGTTITPNALASLLSNILNGNRYYPFIFMPILGGVNEKPELFEITPFGDVSEKKKYGVTGSGTEYAVSALDADYKEGMTQQEALALAVKAISISRNRDIHSGGRSITVAIIDKDGYREVEAKEVEKAMAKIKLNFQKR